MVPPKYFSTQNFDVQSNNQNNFCFWHLLTSLTQSYWPVIASHKCLVLVLSDNRKNHPIGYDPLWQSGQSKWSFQLSMQKDILEQTTIGWSPTHSRIKSRQLLLWFVHAVVHFPTFAHLERGGTAIIFISFPDHPKLRKQETCVNG